MTGLKGNSECCFPKTPEAKLRGTLRLRGKQNSLFPAGLVIKCFVILSNWRIEKKKLQRNRLLDVGWLTNLPRFQEARPDHVWVESSSCCFPRELVSFVCPRELVSFDPRHVTRSPPIGKRIWVGRYNNTVYLQLTSLGYLTLQFVWPLYLQRLKIS